MVEAAEKKALPERLDEFRRALEDEIKAIDTAGTDSILIANGRLIPSSDGEFWYVFDIEYMPMTPPGSPCKVKVGGNYYDATLVRVDQNSLTLASPKPIEGIISKAQLDMGSTVLMESLIKRIEENSEKDNTFGDQLLANPGNREWSKTEQVPKGVNYDSLNSEQIAAVQSGLSNSVTYIWGPPGTGKTQVIGKIIEEAYNLEESVLIVSHTNSAVDNALEKVIIKDDPKVKAPEDEPFPALRLGLSDYWKDKNSRVTEKEHLAFLAQDIQDSINDLQTKKKTLIDDYTKNDQIINRYTWATSEPLSRLSPINQGIEALRLEEQEQEHLGEELDIEIRSFCATYPDAQELVNVLHEVRDQEESIQKLGYKKAEIDRETARLEALIKEINANIHEFEEYKKLLNRLAKYPPLSQLGKDRDEAAQAYEALGETIHKAKKELLSMLDEQQKLQERTGISRIFVSKQRLENLASLIPTTRERITHLESNQEYLRSRCKSLNEDIGTVTRLTKQKSNYHLTNDIDYWNTRLEDTIVLLNEAKDEQLKLSKQHKYISNQKSANRQRLGNQSVLIERYEETLNKAVECADELKRIQTQIKIATTKKATLEAQIVNDFNAVFQEQETSIEPNIVSKTKILLESYDETSIASIRNEQATLQETLKGIDDQIQELERQKETLKAQIILNAKIVGTTLTKAYIDNTLHTRTFDTVIVDEVSMASIPALWCVSLLASKHMIVVGDFLQLPPIVMSNQPLAKKWLGTDVFVLSGVDGRFKKNAITPDNCVALTRQYRMEKDIADIANLYYRSYCELISDNQDRVNERSEFEDYYNRPNDSAPVHIIDTHDLHAWVTTVPRGRGHTSRLNYFSASFTVAYAFKLLEKVLEEGVIESQRKPRILIVAPYRPHVERINKLIRLESINRGFKETTDLIKAGTIHSFQGKEADIVLFDLVVDEPHRRANLFMGGSSSDEDEEIRISQKKLFNVAVTRAKFRLFIIGNIPFLRSHAKNNALGELLDYLVGICKYDIENAKDLMPELVNVPENYYMSDNVPTARLLCDHSKFYDFLLRDFPLAENNVLIFSPFMTEQRIASILPYFTDMITRGVSISIVTKAFEKTMSKRDKRSRVKCEYILKQNRINVFHKLGMHEKLVLIDDHIIWSGSLNVLSHNNKTSEYMQRIDDEDFFADCKKLFNADQYLRLLEEQQEQRCPICGEEMVAREGSQGVYWECVNNDYKRNANQPYPYDGALRCQKCGGAFHFAMKKEPRWICENNHYQKVRISDFRLPKMKALLTREDQKRVADYFDVESLSDRGSMSKSGPLLAAYDLEQYYEELDQASFVLLAEEKAPDNKDPSSAASRAQKPETRGASNLDNDNSLTSATTLQDVEGHSERLIKDTLLDEKYHQFVIFCEANGYETRDDIESLTFDEILNVPGMTTRTANEIFNTIEVDAIEKKDESSHRRSLKEPNLQIEHKYSKEAKGKSLQELKKTVQREYRRVERRTDEGRKRKEPTKAESRNSTGIKGLFDKLDEYGFRYIDNSASSGIIWVALTEAQRESKRQILEGILDQRRLNYAYEPRGAMATKGRPAYRIMIGEK